jgi:hypothetical protein
MKTFLLSSAVEHSAVNRTVAGSIPAVGVPHVEPTLHHVCKSTVQRSAATGDSVTPVVLYTLSTAGRSAMISKVLTGARWLQRVALAKEKRRRCIGVV